MTDDVRDLLQGTGPQAEPPDLDALHDRGVRRRRARRLAVPAAAIAGATMVVLAVVGIGGVAGPVVEDEPVSRPGPTDVATAEDRDASAVVLPPVPDGMREEERGWELVAVSPDRTRLVVELVDVDGCGVALRRASIAASDVAVTVRTFVTVPEGDAPCFLAGGGLPLTVAIDLDEPLDERDLTGCERDDCQQLGLADEGYGAGGVEDELVVRSRPEGLEAFALDDGGSVWSRDTDIRLEARRDELLVARAPRGDVVRLDHDTGEERWRVFEERYGANRTWVTDAVVLVQDRVVFDVLYALDVDDGSLAWTLDLPDTAEIGNVVVTAAGDVLVGATEGGVPTVVRLDPATGQMRERLVIRSGDCGGDECREPSTVGGSLVDAVEEDPVVVLSTGELRVLGDNDGDAFRVVAGAVLSTRDEDLQVIEGTVATGLVNGPTTYRVGGPVESGVSVADELVIEVRRAAASAGELGAETSTWELDLRQPPPVDDGTATVLGGAPGITLGIDGTTGDVVWWRPDELDGDTVPVQRVSVQSSP